VRTLFGYIKVKPVFMAAHICHALFYSYSPYTTVSCSNCIHFWLIPCMSYTSDV
jgi:hypothetical protein